MTDVTDREVEFDPGWYELTDAVGQADGGWRNPPHEVRVVLVGAVWAIPGVLAGLMANLALPFTADPTVAAAAGAVLFAFAGGRMEAVE